MTLPVLPHIKVRPATVSEGLSSTWCFVVLAANYFMLPGFGPIELLILGVITLLLFDRFHDKSNRR